MKKLLCSILFVFGLFLVTSSTYAHVLNFQIQNNTGRDLKIIDAGSDMIGNSWSQGADIPAKGLVFSKNTTLGFTIAYYGQEHHQSDKIRAYIVVVDPTDSSNKCHIRVERREREGFFPHWTKPRLNSSSTCHGTIQFVKPVEKPDRRTILVTLVKHSNVIHR